MDNNTFGPAFKNRGLQVIFGTTLMSIMGISLIAPTLPAMARELNVPKENIGLVITFFTLPGAALAFIIGMLADRYGRKQVLSPSLAIFGIAGAACFFAHDINTLLFLRVLQGIGGAGLVMLGTILIGDMFHGIERARAMGENASVLSIGSGISPLVGGLFALISWNLPYLLFALAIPLSVMVLFTDSPTVKTETAMSRYIADAWSFIKRPKPLIIFAAGIITFILFYGGILTYFSVLLNDKFNASPTIIGVYLSTLSIVAAVTSAQLGKLQSRFSRRSIILAGFMLYSIALFAIPLIGSLPMLLLPLVLFGVGHGLNMPSLQVVATELAPIQYRGAMISVFGTMMKAGQSLGPPVLGLVLAISADLTVVFWSASVVALISALAGFAVMRLYVRTSPVEGS